MASVRLDEIRQCPTSSGAPAVPAPRLRDAQGRLREATGGDLCTLDTLRARFALPNVAWVTLATLDSIITFQNMARRPWSEFPEMLLAFPELDHVAP